jgi:foldase protein PrsA
MSARSVILGVALVLVSGVSACGAGSAGSVVAQVGDVGITRATLDHWMSVLATKDGTANAPAQTERRRALSFLISSEWQIGEAAELGMAVSRREATEQLERQASSFRGGTREWNELLKLSGRTVSDAMLEAQAELASARIDRLALAHRVTLTSAQIATYYTANRRRFTAPEQRRVELVHTESKAVAEKVKSEGASGGGLPSATQPESLVYVKRLRGATNNTVSRAIFAAKPRTLVGPVQVGPNYFVFEVTRVTPGSQQPLAQARPSIEHTLASEGRQQAAAESIKAWRMKWIARTSCRPGFVVQKCRQYIASTSSPPEDPSAFE